MSTDWDVAVVGAGVAGLSAARVAAGAGLRVVAYDRMAPGGQLVNLTSVHDHPAPGETADSAGLVSRLVAEAQAAGVVMAFDEVTRVRSGTPVRLEAGAGAVTAQVVVVATGLGPGRLGLPGEEELVGRGISTCAGCDGPLFRGRAVAVVGDDEWTAEEALELAEVASAVTVLVPGEPRWDADRARRLAAAERVEVLPGVRVTALRGEGVLAAVVVETAGGPRELAVEGLFTYVGRRGPAGLVEEVPADAAGRLPAEGVGAAAGTVLVAGDARSGAVQSVAAAIVDGTAAGEAAVAARRAAAGPAPGGSASAAAPWLRVVDPTYGVPADEADGAVPEGGGADWTEVALFSNSKPNATELLRGVGDRLQEHWGLAELGFASKPNASAAADKDVIDWLAQRYKVVLVAVGD
ncbi:NAD(P)/FAD-dependent oxidoreductase [Blastococcus sp. KM273129]|uniref:NAD(P)/FAD-dependent oxidoreductase n=1 Tax=Blastococcus sp. KM273129 TaxID=2570315 RepID=UPI001F489024|nr:NAD(P)/FAD-dependent oxidoreductase [Blastococcus sp. KM273129]MCF6736376.1 pyridine nucleotide-disulfide oxidoreductase [Blastococcus sp. KM273129]